MNKGYLDSLGSPLVDIKVLIQSPVRVQVRTRTFWTGYNGNGPDRKLDGNHTNEKTFTIYRDGKIYVEATDMLLGGGGEEGGASGEHGPTGAASAKSTFIHPINSRSQAGFTLGTNYSLNALGLSPRGGGVAKWLLQWGQDSKPDPVSNLRCSTDEQCTSMNFLQVPLNSSMSISQSGSFSYTYFQPMQQAKPSWNAGYRWGVAPNALAFPALSSYKKNFLYHLGTAGSSLMPNIVTLGIANSIADAYLQPARVWLGVGSGVPADFGVFDYSEGCHRIQVHCNVSAKQSVRFTLETASELRHPVFCLDGWRAANSSHAYSASVGGSIDLLPHEVAGAFETGSGLLVVQLLRTLPRGRHAVLFEAR
eukprot:SAG31_NODE_2326_length_5940_cov_2.687896_2_plen_365_part_00